MIFISHSADPERIVRGIRAGAVGWVCQYEPFDRLLHVIRKAATREIWLPPGQAAVVLRLLARGPDPDRNHGAELRARPIGHEREIVLRAVGAVHRRRRGNWSRARVSAYACLPSPRMTVISTSPKRFVTSAIQAATRWLFLLATTTTSGLNRAKRRRPTSFSSQVKYGMRRELLWRLNGAQPRPSL